MVQNLYQVKKSKDLLKILDKHRDKLSVIMFSSKNCGPCIKFKSTFQKIAKSYVHDFFIYVDITNFSDPNGQFLKDVNVTPMFFFFYNHTLLHIMKGAILEEINIIIHAGHKHMEEIKEKQNIKPQHNIQEVSNISNTTEHIQEDNISNQQLETQKSIEINQSVHTEPLNIIDQKMEMMRLLHNLHTGGAPVSRHFNLNDSLEDMITEYNKVVTIQLPTSNANQIEHTTQQPENTLQMQADSSMYVEQTNKMTKEEREEYITQIRNLEKMRDIALQESSKRLTMLQRIKQEKLRMEANEQRYSR